MTTLGWIHLASAICALAVGGVVVARPKGTRSHRWLGRVYVVSMVVLMATAFSIYRLFDGWGVFHWLAVVGALTLAGGYGAVRLRRRLSGWLDLHYHLMGYSYVGLLAAAGAEAAVRIPGAVFGWAAGGTSVVVVAAGAWIIHTRAARVLDRVRRRRGGSA